MNQDKINQEHLDNPKVGDYWDEMTMPIAIVLDVNEDKIIICDSAKYLDDSWTWNEDRVKTITKEKMREDFSYETIPDKTWCRCLPEKHKEWAMAWRHYNMDKLIDNLFNSIME